MARSMRRCRLPPSSRGSVAPIAWRGVSLDGLRRTTPDWDARGRRQPPRRRSGRNRAAAMVGFAARARVIASPSVKPGAGRRRRLGGNTPHRPSSATPPRSHAYAIRAISTARRPGRGTSSDRCPVHRAAFGLAAADVQLCASDWSPSSSSPGAVSIVWMTVIWSPSTLSECGHPGRRA